MKALGRQRPVSLLGVSDCSMRGRASLGPQHVCASVSEVSWSSESQPAAAPHSIIRALLMKEWPSEKSHLIRGAGTGCHTRKAAPWRQEEGGSLGASDREPEIWVLAPEGQATVFGRPHSGPLCPVCVIVGVGMREG